MGLATALRLYHLSARSIWSDEAWSLWVARHSLPEIWRWLVKLDTNPPFYYVLLHFWLGWGDSETALRLLSVVMGILTVPVVYGLGRTIGGHRLGLVAGVMFATSPIHVQYDQEARMYPLLTLAAAVAMWGVAQLLKSPENAGAPIRGGWQAWVAYIVGTTIALWSHSLAVFLPVAANVVVLSLWVGRRRARGALRNWSLAQGVVFLLWLPWLPSFAHQAAKVSQDFWIPTPSVHVVTESFGMLYAWGVPSPLSVLAGLCVLGFVVIGVLGWRGERRWVVFTVAFGLIAPAGELFLSFHRPLFWFYMFLWTSVPVYLMVAAGIDHLRPRPAFGLGLATVMAINLVGLTVYFATIKKVKMEAWDGPAAYVAEHLQVGDLILFNDPFVQLPFDYYFRKHPTPVEEHGVPADFHAGPLLEPKMSDSDVPALQAVARLHRRVWLVYCHDWFTDPHQIAPRALHQVARLAEDKEFWGVRLLLYVNDKAQ